MEAKNELLEFLKKYEEEGKLKNIHAVKGGILLTTHDGVKWKDVLLMNDDIIQIHSDLLC